MKTLLVVVAMVMVAGVALAEEPTLGFPWCPDVQVTCQCDCNNFSELPGLFRVNIKGLVHCGTIITNGDSFLMIDAQDRVYYVLEKNRTMRQVKDCGNGELAE